jgi:hypothetical protein
MYLVVECTTMSAPRASGFCQAGDRKVLSTTTSVPRPRTFSTSAAMSVMRSSGLLGVSIHSRSVFSDSAASSAAASAKRTKSTLSSLRRVQAEKSR